MEYTKHILITGGAGFIGSHVVRLFVNKYPDYRIINFDKLTYAGNLANLKDVEHASNYTFVKGDIVQLEDVKSVFETYGITDVIHLAAESHVDRSIEGPMDFVMTNVGITWKDMYFIMSQQMRCMVRLGKRGCLKKRRPMTQEVRTLHPKHLLIILFQRIIIPMVYL